MSRALGFAAVLLLVGGGLAEPLQAQENLDAGKSPGQLFSGTCSACHKSPRGLLKTVPAGSLQGFLRQHYTTSPEMAGVLASYLVSNGASDTRYMGGQGKGAKDGKEARDGKETKSEAKPEAGGEPSDQTDRPSRKRRARSAAEPAAEEGQAPAASQTAAAGDTESKSRTGHRGRHRLHPAAATETRPDGDAQVQAAEPEHGRKGSKHKRAKTGADQAAKPDAVKEEPTSAAPPDAGHIDAAKPAASDETPTAAVPSSEPPRVEAPKASEAPPALRADPEQPVAASTTSPATTQSVPAASSAGASDPSIPTAPSQPAEKTTAAPSAPSEPSDSH